MAAGVTGGSILLKHAQLDLFGAAKEVIEAAGMVLDATPEGVVGRARQWRPARAAMP